MIACHECGMTLEPQWRHCPACGAEVLRVEGASTIDRSQTSVDELTHAHPDSEVTTPTWSGSSPLASWLEFGFAESEARQWKDALGSPNLAADWRDAGFSPSDAQQWRDAGIADAASARAHRSSGLSLEQARDVEWQLSGFSTEDVGAWDALELFPHVASEWRTLGFTPEEAALWLDVYFILDATDAADWRAAVSTPERARTWYELTDLSADAAMAWSAAGFEPADVPPWIATWGPDNDFAEDAAIWRDLGFSAQEAHRWNEHLATFDVAEETAPLAHEWHTAGFSSEDARAWRAIDEVDDLEDAQEWRDLGFEPYEARVWLAVDDIDFADEAWTFFQRHARR